jgi:maltose alpha-D-glucosyltransferase/alpha-amylase
MDLVVNHTSDQHPWFRTALENQDSPYRDHYIWRDNLDDVPALEPVFPGFEESVWQYVPVRKQWYLHHFYRFEPDLNHQHPDVQEEIRRIIGYWLDLGVDGFRLDAAPFLGEDLKGGTPDPHAILKSIRGWVSERNPDACLLAEADLPAVDLPAYFGEDGDQVHALFDFLLNRRLFLALAQDSAEPLHKSLTECPPAKPGTAWVSFLRHHDELSLSFIDKAEAAQIFDRFAPEPSMQIYNRGIRRRLAPLMDNDPDLLRMVFSFQLSLPSVPALTYGDEIGLGDNLSLPERAAVRTTMRWETPGASPTTMLLPNIVSRDADPIPVDPPPVMEGANEFRGWLRDLITLRSELLHDSRDTFELVEGENPRLLVHQYHHDGGNILCVHNFAAQPQVVDLKGIGESAEVILTSSGDLDQPVSLETMEIEGHGYRWLRTTSAAKATSSGRN